jgi:hypothetical protein
MNEPKLQFLPFSCPLCRPITLLFNELIIGAPDEPFSVEHE